MRTFTAVAALLCLQATPTLAQDKSAATGLAKDQLAKIQQINARYDAQVKAGFAGDDKTVAAMRAELKTIDAEKDSSKRKAAIAAYQTKHAKTYKAALAKGKVNLSSWASELNNIAPNYAFMVKDGTHLVALGGSDTAPDPAPVPPAPTTRTLRGADFTFTKDTGCGPISGSNVTRSGLDLTSDTWAAEVGGCRNLGDLTHALTLAPDQTARVELKVDLNSEVWAVGAIAVAFSFGATSVSVSGTDHRYNEGESINCSAGAPFLWAASESCGGEDIRLSPRLTTAGGYEIKASTYVTTFAGGIVAASAAKSTIRNLSAKITLEPR